MTDSRASRHYHRPRMLNGRVRNGNGCSHPGLVTGRRTLIQRGSGRVCKGISSSSLWFGRRPEERINAAKRLAVSTG